MSSISIHHQTKRLNIILLFVVAFLLLVNFPLGTWEVLAQSSRMSQVITTPLGKGEIHFYRTIPLETGDILYINLEGISGNLDPLITVVEGDTDGSKLRDTFNQKLDEATADGLDPLVAFEGIADELFLDWDDDSGEGYDAKLAFEVSSDGEFLLVIVNAPGTNSFGDYQLKLGLNEPIVLTDEFEEGEDLIATFQKETSRFGVAVQKITGSLTREKSSTLLNLRNLLAGDTLYAYIEGVSGNLIPVLTLRDFGGKPVRTANLLGLDNNGSLQYTFDELGTNYYLQVESWKNGDRITEGDFRLIVGVNAPEVLSGQVQEKGSNDLVRAPIDVSVGLKIDQITGVDQREENFSAVADLQMEWQDPRLAFNPDTCQCSFKVFNEKTFSNFIAETGGNWPDFVLTNQQGNRWTQNRTGVIFPDGRAQYLERFTTDFQAPDFDFKRFPFDTQQFYVRVRSLFPEEFYQFSNNEVITGMGDQLGEEEWIFTDTDTTITSEGDNSQFNFRFEAVRQLTYYIARIFVPLILIIIVSWITFFLKDYDKRVDVTAANLLLFIAYNFTIANDLPRLGYLTFFDKILISTFGISVLVVVYNVILKRLEVIGKGEMANQIDNFMDWIYPILYIGVFAIIYMNSY